MSKGIVLSPVSTDTYYAHSWGGWVKRGNWCISCLEVGVFLGARHFVEWHFVEQTTYAHSFSWMPCCLTVTVSDIKSLRLRNNTDFHWALHVHTSFGDCLSRSQKCDNHDESYIFLFWMWIDWEWLSETYSVIVLIIILYFSSFCICVTPFMCFRQASLVWFMLSQRYCKRKSTCLRELTHLDVKQWSISTALHFFVQQRKMLSF